MASLKNCDVNKVIWALPRPVRELIQEGFCYLAGGFIRSMVVGEEANDIDLFCSNLNDERRVFDQLEKIKEHSCKTQFAITYNHFSPAVQLITKWHYETVKECLGAFDFTIAKAIIWNDGEEWQSECHKDYYADLAARRLVYEAPLSADTAGGSVLRMLKFYRRGFHAPLKTIAEVLAHADRGIVRGFSAIELGATKSLEEQYYNILKEVDPNAQSLHDVEAD